MRPDFIIGGAPKCGTTSLHKILDRHPDLWLVPNEVYFFDADDALAHHDFLDVQNNELIWRDPDGAEFQDWHDRKFADAPQGALTGEDSTSYLMSEVAPHRIAARGPETKVIFMLRDPVKRAFSQYWHLVRSGRTTLQFEAALSTERSILMGSTYAPRLRCYIDALGQDRVHVCLFEDFNADRQAEIDRITDFLGVARMSTADLPTWFNRTRYPRKTTTLLRLNRVGKALVRYRYVRHLGGQRSVMARLGHRSYRAWFNFVSKRILREDTAPEPMREGTRRYLQAHLSLRNTGLSDLIGRKLSDIWPGYSQ